MKQMLLRELATKYLLEYYKKNPDAVQNMTNDLKGVVINDYNTIIKKDDNYYGQMTKLLTQYEKCKTPSKRLSILKKVLEVDPNDVDALSSSYLLDESISQEELLNKLLALEVKSKEDLIKQDICRFDEEEEKEGTDYFLLLNCRPYLRLLKTLADCYSKIDEEDKAIQYLEIVTNYCKKDQLQTSDELACLYFKKRDYSKGILFCKAHEDSSLACYLVKHMFLIANKTETHGDAFKEISTKNWILGATLARKISMSDQEIDRIFTEVPYVVRGSLKESVITVENVIGKALKDDKERVAYSDSFAKAGKNFKLKDHLYFEDINILGALFFAYSPKDKVACEIKETALYNLLVGKGAKTKFPYANNFYGVIPDLKMKDFQDNLNILYNLGMIDISQDHYCFLTIDGEIMVENALKESAGIKE